MKFAILLFILMATAAAQTSSPALSNRPEPAKSLERQKSPAAIKAVDTNAQQARKIIEQSIQALGGQPYLKFKSLKQQGRGFGFDRTGASAGVGMSFTRFYAYPEKERYDFFRDGEWVIIHDGDKGYETTYHGTREQDMDEISDYIRRRQFALDRVLREWAHDQRTGFFYEGLTISETKQAHQISLMNFRNQAVTLFIDVKTLLPVKKTYSWRNVEMREMWEESEMYDGYRLVQGIQTPFILTGSRNGKMTGQRFLKTVEFDIALDPLLFVPPPLKNDLKKK